MTSTRDVDTVLAHQDLPLELRRLATTQEGIEPRVATMLSGIVAARQSDEVICSTLLRRNLVVPGHHGAPSRLVGLS